MRIDESWMKSVAFLAIRLQNDEFVYVGTAFWLGRNEPGSYFSKRTYLVTARHVLDDIRRKTAVEELWLRVNYKDGSAKWICTQMSQWYMNPSDSSLDVAVLEWAVPQEYDHLVIPLSLCMSPEVAAANEVSLGDEVVIVGLFKHHYGEARNIPIIRVGNLAMKGEEGIQTKAFGKIDGYLIEARSIGGLSGSPVFLNFGPTRVLGGKFMHSTNAVAILLGLVHGHYDVSGDEIDAAGGQSDRVNTGIAIVVPAHSIVTVIEQYEKQG